MKKAVIFATTIMLVAILTVTAFATVGSADKTIHYRDIKINLDGTSITPKDAAGNTVEPFIIDGTTYLPLRAIAEALGLDVVWNNDTSTAVLTTRSSSTGDDLDGMVYITRTGSKYHHESTCNGGTYWPVPFSTATGMGLTPCDKCVN